MKNTKILKIIETNYLILCKCACTGSIYGSDFKTLDIP